MCLSFMESELIQWETFLLVPTHLVHPSASFLWFCFVVFIHSLSRSYVSVFAIAHKPVDFELLYHPGRLYAVSAHYFPWNLFKIDTIISKL